MFNLGSNWGDSFFLLRNFCKISTKRALDISWLLLVSMNVHIHNHGLVDHLQTHLSWWKMYENIYHHTFKFLMQILVAFHISFQSVLFEDCCDLCIYFLAQNELYQNRNPRTLFTKVTRLVQKSRNLLHSRFLRKTWLYWYVNPL